MTKTVHPATLVMPIWHNTIWVQRGTDIYQAIGKHANILNKHHSSFWGVAQQFAINEAIICLMKCFNTGRYNVSKMIGGLQNSGSDKLETQTIKTINKMGIFRDSSNNPISAETEIKAVIPQIKQTNPTEKHSILHSKFESIRTIRSEFLCHQVETAVDLGVNTTVADIEEVNNWVRNMCKLFVYITTPETSLPEGGPCVHTATMNVIAKILGENFSDPNRTWYDNENALSDFYKRLP